MLKKIIIALVAVSFLAGAENLLAKEYRDEPQRAQKRFRAQRGENKGSQTGQQQFDKWFNALTKAYKQNDRQKMEQLLRDMRLRRQEQGANASERPGRLRQGKAGTGRGFERAGKGGRDRALWQQGERKSGEAVRRKGITRRGKHRFQGRGEDRQGQGFRRRDSDRRPGRRCFHEDYRQHWSRERGFRHEGRDIGQHRRGMHDEAEEHQWRDRGYLRRNWDKWDEDDSEIDMRQDSDFDWDR